MTSCFAEIGPKMQKSRFMLGYMTHCVTELEQEKKADDKKDKNIVTGMVTGITDLTKGIIKTGTNMLQIGVNFMIPLNIFWDKVFCMMATSKSYVVSAKQLMDSHLDTKLLRANQLPNWMEMDTLYIWKVDRLTGNSEMKSKIPVK